MRSRGTMVAVRPLAFAAAALGASLSCGGATVIARTQDGVTVDADVPVKITATAVKPALLHLFNGYEATFVNQDSVPRTVGADVARSDQAGCVAVGVGLLQPGETRTSARLPGFAACYFRDEQRPADAAFQGVVVTH